MFERGLAVLSLVGVLGGCAAKGPAPAPPPAQLASPQADAMGRYQGEPFLANYLGGLSVGGSHELVFAPAGGATAETQLAAGEHVLILVAGPSWGGGAERVPLEVPEEALPFFAAEPGVGTALGLRAWLIENEGPEELNAGLGARSMSAEQFEGWQTLGGYARVRVVTGDDGQTLALDFALLFAEGAVSGTVGLGPNEAPPRGAAGKRD